MSLNIFKIFALIVILFLNTLIYSDITKSNEELLSQAYGYLKGQEYSLSKISETNPALKSEVVKTELKFDSTFGKAKKNIEIELETLFGDYFDTYKSEMEKQFKDLFSNQTYGIETSLTFLKEVEKRSEGEIQSPILETFLTYQYIDNPSKEISTGFLKSYTTKGHTKSKNIDINAKVPLSWRQEEGERPNIIQKFTSNNGKGLESFLFMVKDLGLSEDYIITKRELNDFFNEEELKKMIPENSAFESAQRIYLDGQISGQIIFTSDVKRLDFSINIKSIHYITVIEDKMFFLQCMVSTSDNKDLDERFNLFLPLFNKIANSLVFPKKYNGKNPINTVNSINNTNNLNKNKSNIEYQLDLASKKMDEGIGRIGAFLIFIILYIFFKSIQWFYIRNKISENTLNKARNNINKLGKYSKIWAIIQFLSAALFIMTWQVTNLILMTIISILVYWAGVKLSKKDYYSFNPILSVFSVTSFFSFIMPVIAIILIIKDEATLGKFGFLWLKLFNEIQIIRFGPAFLTLILCFYSISSMYSYLVIKRTLNTHNTAIPANRGA